MAELVLFILGGIFNKTHLSFLGVPLPSMLVLISNNRKCPCGRPYDAHAHCNVVDETVM